MKWAGVLLVLAGACCVVYVIRGVYVRDGLALLGVAFLFAAAVAGLLTRKVERGRKR